MLLHRRLSILIIPVSLMAGFITACQPAPVLGTSSALGVSVGIQDDLCPNVVVRVGQVVTWTNQADHEHVVNNMSAAGKNDFDSGVLQPGDSFEFTFLQSKSYNYECSADGSLTGTITVEP